MLYRCQAAQRWNQGWFKAMAGLTTRNQAKAKLHRLPLRIVVVDSAVENLNYLANSYFVWPSMGIDNIFIYPKLVFEYLAKSEVKKNFGY
jgi:hypothetical protein